MKTFRTVGSGSTQTIEPIENNKIPVYETQTAAETDLANLEVGQIIATKDEGNELSNPVDVVQDGNMHAVTSNAVADGLSYSTDEVKTGGKWIDVKPIYRKTISCGALPNNTAKNVAHGIENLGIVVSANGTAADNNTGVSIPIPYTSSNFIGFYITKTNITIFTVHDDTSYTDTYVTIYYTKTTD